MNLCKFNSNSKDLKELLKLNNIAVSDSIAFAKILGLIWDRNEDSIKFGAIALEQSIMQNKQITKRSILKFVEKFMIQMD